MTTTKSPPSLILGLGLVSKDSANVERQREIVTTGRELNIKVLDTSRVYVDSFIIPVYYKIESWPVFLGRWCFRRIHRQWRLSFRIQHRHQGTDGTHTRWCIEKGNPAIMEREWGGFESEEGSIPYNPVRLALHVDIDRLNTTSFTSQTRQHQSARRWKESKPYT